MPGGGENKISALILFLFWYNHPGKPKWGGNGYELF
jgi:hypothetical protein